MIAGKRVPISAETVREALEAAVAIVDPRWVDAQRRRETHDPTLVHLKRAGTLDQTVRAVEEGVTGAMHPIAETILVAEQLLQRYEETKRLDYSSKVYLLFSLRDVARSIDRIPHAKERLPRLKEENWVDTLYELLTAAAYSQVVGVEVVPEEARATPDLRLAHEPPVYVECKAKLQYEKTLREFRQRWSREALGQIVRLLDTVTEGIMVRVTLEEERAIAEVPFLFNVAIANRMEAIRQKGVVMDLTWRGPDEWIPPEGVPVDPEGLWERLFGFNEWTAWHHILPGMGVKLVDSDKRIVNRVRRPKLICVRAAWLGDTEQDIFQTLKDACQRQLRKHQPGIIHLLINADLFELGDRISVVNIATMVTKCSQNIFRDYSRVGKIVYDLAIPPRAATYSACAERIIDTNGRCEAFPNGYVEPPKVLLF